MKTLQNIEKLVLMEDSTDKKLITDFDNLKNIVELSLQQDNQSNLENYIKQLSTEENQKKPSIIDRLITRSCYKKAMEANELVKRCMEKNNCFNEKNKIKYLFDKARIYYKLAYYEDAIKAYKEIEDLYQSIDTGFKRDPLNAYNFAAFLNNYGDFLRELGDFVSAKKKYEQSLRKKQTLYTHFDQNLHNLDDDGKVFLTNIKTALSHSHSNLGLIQRQTADYMDALECYKQARRYNAGDLSSIESGEADVYLEVGNHEKSNELRKTIQVVQITITPEAIANDDSIPLALRAAKLCNTGRLLYDRGEFKEGYEYYLKSLTIYKFIFEENENHPEIALVYNNLANYHLLQQTDLDKNIAIQYYHKSLSIYSKIFPKMLINDVEIILHPRALEYYINIANVYKAKGQYDQALISFNKGINAYEVFWSKQRKLNHPKIALIKKVMGEAYLLKNNYDEALKFYDEAIAIIQPFISENLHINDLALILKAKGDVLMKKGDFIEAIKFYLLSEEKWKWLVTNNYISKFHFEVNDCSAALAYCYYIYAHSLLDSIEKKTNLEKCIAICNNLIDFNKELISNNQFLINLTSYDFTRQVQLLSLLTKAYLGRGEIVLAKQVYLHQAQLLYDKISALPSKIDLLYLVDLYLERGYQIAVISNDSEICCRYLVMRAEIAHRQNRPLKELIFLRKVIGWNPAHPLQPNIAILSIKKVELDEDVESKIHHIKESYHELMMRYLEDLSSQTGELSNYVKNRTGELMIAIRSVLDHVYTRFTRNVVYNSPETSENKAENVRNLRFFYYPYAQKETDFEEPIAKKWNKDAVKPLPVPAKVHNDLKDAYQAILHEQAFYYYSPQYDLTGQNRKNSWLEKINNIHNDTKHLRLTPQAGSSELNTQYGYLTQRKVKVFIDFVQANLTSWCFIDCFRNKTTYKEQYDLSENLYTWLNDQSFIDKKGAITNLNLFHYAQAYLEDKEDLMKKYKSDFARELLTKDGGYFNKNGYKSYLINVLNLMSKRILQQRGIEIESDQQIDISELLKTAINKAETIAVILHQESKTKLNRSDARTANRSETALKDLPPNINDGDLLTEYTNYQNFLLIYDPLISSIDNVINLHLQAKKLAHFYLKKNNFANASDIYFKFAIKFTDNNKYIALYAFTKVAEILELGDDSFEKQINFLLTFCRFYLENYLFDRAEKILKNAEFLLYKLPLDKRNGIPEQIQKITQEIKDLKIANGYDAIDTDIVSQLEYIAEQEMTLEWELFAYFERLQSNETNELLDISIQQRIFDLIIKTRHSIENIFERLIVLTVDKKVFSEGAKFPEYNFEDYATLQNAINTIPNVDLAQAAKVIPIITQFQDFNHITNGRAPWLNTFIKLSNFLKHTGALKLRQPTTKADFVGRPIQDFVNSFSIEWRSDKLGVNSFSGYAGLTEAQSATLFNDLSSNHLIIDGEFCKTGGNAGIKALKSIIRQEFFNYMLDNTKTYNNFKGTPAYVCLVNELKKTAVLSTKTSNEVDAIAEILMFNLSQRYFFRQLREIQPLFVNISLINQFRQAVNDIRIFSRDAFQLLKNTAYLNVNPSITWEIDNTAKDEIEHKLHEAQKAPVAPGTLYGKPVASPVAKGEKNIANMPIILKP